MMTSKKVAFIGGGNMAEALIKGVLVSRRFDKGQIGVSDIRQERLNHLQQTYQVAIATDNAELAGGANVIVIAVKPQQMSDVIAEIRDSLKHLPLLISIAAGVRLAHIERGLGKPVPVVRAMPNAAALILAGASAITGGTHADSDHLSIARDLFEAVGLVVDVDETHMDAVTGLSGSGPAYVFLFIEALIDAGVMMGLPRPVARDFAVQTTLGAAKILAESDAHPAVLKDQITSPGGTTIHGLAVLETGAIRGILMNAVAAATHRAMELGKRER